MYPEALPNNSVWVPRMSASTASRVIMKNPNTGDDVIIDSEGRPGGAKYLRPKPDQRTEMCTEYTSENPSDQHDSYAFINKRLMVNSFNNFLKWHRETVYCNDLQVDIREFLQQGVTGRIVYVCQSCDFFVDEPYKLFHEMSEKGSRGPAAAACNVAMQVGLQETPIGNSSMRTILSAMNSNAPCRKTMQKHSDRVAIKVTNLNDSDMDRRLESLRHVNVLRGVAEPEKINIQTDARYNSTTIATRNRPGQAANLSVSIAREDVTAEHQIIAHAVRQKLCTKGDYLRAKGISIKCPGHDGCSANIAAHKPLLESDMSCELSTKIGKKDYKVDHVTTDGDSKSASGINTGMKKVYGPQASKSKRLADKVHRGCTQFKHGMRMPFSKEMFPGRDKLEQDAMKKVFLRDIKNRTEVVWNNLFAIYGYDTDALIKRALPIPKRLLQCYSGNHILCPKIPEMGCKGEHDDNWLKNSKILQSHYLLKKKLTGFHMTPSDKGYVLRLFFFKLSPVSIRELRMNTSTQRSEAFNRTLSAVIPKNVNYARNSYGRISGAIHRTNNRFGNSLLRKLEVCGVPVPKGSSAAKRIASMQRAKKYHIDYKKRPDVMKHRSELRLKKDTAFYQHKKRKLDYKKGLLEPTLYGIENDHGGYVMADGPIFCRKSTFRKYAPLALRMPRQPRQLCMSQIQAIR